MPDLFPFDWLQPDMMAGSILLVDREKNEAHQYNPIREEIIVQRWDRFAAQQNLVPEIDRWLTVPGPDDYDLDWAASSTSASQPYYVVLARRKADPRSIVRVSHSSRNMVGRRVPLLRADRTSRPCAACCRTYVSMAARWKIAFGICLASASVTYMFNAMFHISGFRSYKERPW